MGAAPEVLDCERFVRAWTRFRERFPDERLSSDHEDLLRQYAQTADFFQDKANDSLDPEMWKDLVDVLQNISRDSSQLVASNNQPGPSSGFHLPRTKEILRRRRQLSSVVALAARPTELLDGCEEPSVISPHIADRVEFNHSDFKAMLDVKEPTQEKLSAQDIRRRLGLLDRSGGGNQASTTEFIAREEQESIKADMVNLAKTLKERTQTINQSLVDDVKILDAVGQSAESSAELLEREITVLKQQLASSIGLWTSLWLVMGAVMVFMATYIYMKLFSRRHW